MGTGTVLIEASPALPRTDAEAAAPVRRLAAGMVDLLLLLGGLLVVLAIAFSAGGWEVWAVLAWVLGFGPLYFALYHGFDKCATPGQLELRIALADGRGPAGPPIRRALARSYLGLLFLVLVLPALADLLVLVGSRRSLRDRLTKTAVVHLRLPGPVAELREATVPALLDLFEPAAGTRRYLRRGWALVRVRPRALVGTVACVFGALFLIAVVLGFLTVADAPSDYWAWLEYLTLVLALLASTVYWTQGALLLAVERVRTGAVRGGPGRDLVRASRRLNALSAALVLLLVLGAVAAGLFYLVVPPLVVSRLTLVVPALVLEDRRVLGSLRRSWELTRGTTWRVFGLVLLSVTLLVAFAVGEIVTIGGVGAVSPDNGSSRALIALLLVVVVLVSFPFVLVLTWLGSAWSLVYEDARRARPPREAS